MAIAVTSVSMVAVTGLLHASARFMRNQELQVETTQAARASIDSMVRDLRLGGACLPITGDFIALDGVNNGTEDQITTRAGIARPDLSCVNSTTTADVVTGSTTISVQNVNGFVVGMRAYIRGTDGSGEFFTISAVSSGSNTITRSPAASQAYASTSGVYAIDERTYSINHWAASWGDTPELMLEINNQGAQSFAVGIEKLDIQYQLARNCPPCDTVNIPATDDEWRLVQQIFLTVTARSDKKNLNGQYYRRTLTVGVKPRNLLPG